jgi:hypothetical protein
LNCNCFWITWLVILVKKRLFHAPNQFLEFIEITILEGRTIHCSFNLAMVDWHIWASSKFCHLSNTWSSYIYCMG